MQKTTIADRSRLGLLICALLLAIGQLGCQRNQEGSIEPIDPAPPEFVYTPESAIEARVHIQVPARVQKGKPIRLHAQRETIGNWKRVRHAELPPDAVWFEVPPPAYEQEVAANLTWKTDPPLAAQFDVGLRSMSLGMEREATFKAAGTYKIWAHSAVPVQSLSNVVVVEVTD